MSLILSIQYMYYTCTYIFFMLKTFFGNINYGLNFPSPLTSHKTLPHPLAPHGEGGWGRPLFLLSLPSQPLSLFVNDFFFSFSFLPFPFPWILVLFSFIFVVSGWKFGCNFFWFGSFFLGCNKSYQWCYLSWWRRWRQRR